MMNCRDYIFKLTSGQLKQATNLDRFWAAQHRLICRRCRSFSRNDQQLDTILDDYREHLTQSSDEPPSGTR